MPQRVGPDMTSLNEQRNPKVPIDPDTALNRLRTGLDARRATEVRRVHIPLDPDAAFKRLLYRLSLINV